MRIIKASDHLQFKIMSLKLKKRKPSIFFISIVTMYQSNHVTAYLRTNNAFAKSTGICGFCNLPMYIKVYFLSFLQKCVTKELMFVFFKSSFSNLG